MHSDPQRALAELSRRGCFVAMNSGSSMARYRPDGAPFLGRGLDVCRTVARPGAENYSTRVLRTRSRTSDTRLLIRVSAGRLREP
jgi:hypothetical protein